MVPVLSDGGFRVECFDAARVGDGPVAVLRGRTNQRLPFLLHAVWMESAAPAPDTERNRFAEEISDGPAADAVARLEPHLRDAVLEVAAR